jgi:hypothetical protein
MLWLGLALSQQKYSWAKYSSLQNIMAYYCFISVMYLEKKTTKNCENLRNCKGM